MRRYLISLLILIPVSLMAYHYSLINFLLIIIAGMNLAVLMVIGIVKMFKRNLSHRWLKIPFLIIMICSIGIAIGLLRPLEPATISSNDVSKTLAYAYETDQGDRKNLQFYLGIFKDKMKLRDSMRLEQVKKLYEGNQIYKPLDKFHAAFILHHSRESELYEIAHELASKAASADALKNVYQVQWLVKATFDRWMLSIGKPQKYNTQGKVGFSVE